MKNKPWLLASLAAIIAALAVALYPTDNSATRSVDSLHTQQIAPDTAATPIANTADAEKAPQSSREASASSWPSSREVIAGQEASDKVAFKVDARGRIVTDEEARLNIEKLFALNGHEQLTKKQRELQDSLPPAAARELADLMEQYNNYQIAQRQVLPPGQEPASADDGITQIDVLHGLRVQYFGPTVAEGFFGAEEKIQRELLQLMSLEKDQSMTMEEKAARAQALYNSLPAIAAAEERGKADADVTHP